MTNRFDEVAQLKALPGRREAIIKIEIERDLLEAAPWRCPQRGSF